MTTTLNDRYAVALTDVVRDCMVAGVDVSGSAGAALRALRDGSLTNDKARGFIESLRTRLYEAKDLPRCP
jgi:hypothetical protein